MSFEDINKPPSEVKTEKELTPEEKQKQEEDRSIRKMFTEIKAGKQKPEEAVQKISNLVKAPELAQLLTPEQQDFIVEDLQDALKNTDEGKFMTEVTGAIQPLLELKRKQPELFEDIQARAFVENGGFTPLNKRISYGLFKEDAHFHLAPSYTVKEQLPELFFDAMNKLQKIVEGNPEIKKITGTSWIVATKSYGELLKRLGFDISEVPAKIKEEHFAGEKRAMKMASMTREKFLNTNWNWEDVKKLLAEVSQSAKIEK